MQTHPTTALSHGWRGYFYAAAFVLAALLVRLPFERLLEGAGPFVTFFPAILLSAWLLGAGPTVLAVVLSTVSVVYFFMAPTLSVGLVHRRDVAAVVMFLIVDVA